MRFGQKFAYVAKMAAIQEITLVLNTGSGELFRLISRCHRHHTDVIDYANISCFSNIYILYICTYTHIYRYICPDINIIYTCICVHTHVHEQVCIYYIHTIHICIYTCLHTVSICRSTACVHIYVCAHIKLK